MLVLVVGLVVFLGVHSLSIVAGGWRDQRVLQMGVRPWKLVYAAIALVCFVLIVHGYGLARQEQTFLYHPPVWMRHISALLMLFAFPIFLSTYFPGHIKRVLKHPMLVSVKIWALAHLLANGGIADILLFGTFLIWAVVDRISLKRRVSSAAIAMPAAKVNDIIVVVMGLGLYMWFIMMAHKWLFGVSPMGT